MTSQICYKASQWSALSRPHVSRVLDFAAQPLALQRRHGCLFKHGRTRLLEASSEIDLQGSESSSRLGCPDEYWPMWVLFGNHSFRARPDLSLMLTLRTREYTWADWEDLGWTNHSRITLVAGSVGGWAGPATVVRFTQAGLQGLVESEFLFMRKVLQGTTYEDGSLTLREAFRKHVFGLGGVR